MISLELANHSGPLVSGLGRGINTADAGADPKVVFCWNTGFELDGANTNTVR